MYRTPSFGSVRGSSSGSLKELDNRDRDSNTPTYSNIPKFDDIKLRAGQSTGKLERGGSVSRLRDNITMSSGLDRSASATKSYIPLNQRTGYLRPTPARTTLRSTSSSSVEEPSSPLNGDVSLFTLLLSFWFGLLVKHNMFGINVNLIIKMISEFAIDLDFRTYVYILYSYSNVIYVSFRL